MANMNRRALSCTLESNNEKDTGNTSGWGVGFFMSSRPCMRVGETVLNGKSSDLSVRRRAERGELQPFVA